MALNTLLHYLFFVTLESSAVSPQFIGIIVGILVYVVTITVVIFLLIYGGSFKRMKEQAENYEKDGPTVFKAPSQRPKLHDHLLKAKAELPTKPDLPGESIEGKFVQLCILNNNSDDVAKLFEISNGLPCLGHNSYDPEEKVWNFLQYGPFKTLEEMMQSPFSKQPENGLRLVMIDVLLGKTVGSISLLDNNTPSLRIQIGDFWLTPAYQGKEYILSEAVFLLMNHLFDSGYRRIELSVDAADTGRRKFAEKCGFVLEGVLRKHMIIGECSRDSAIYSVLNNEWDVASVQLIKDIKNGEKMPEYQIWMKKKNANQVQNQLDLSTSTSTVQTKKKDV